MDPITGLQTAASIVGIVDVAIRFGIKASQIYKSDTLPEVEDWRIVSTDSQNLVIRLNTKLNGPFGQRPLNENDQAIEDLCQRAELVTRELVRATADLLDPNGKSMWRAIRVSGKILKRQRAIEDLLSRLSNIRGELLLRLLTHLYATSQEERISGNDRFGLLLNSLETVKDRCIEDSRVLLDQLYTQAREDSRRYIRTESKNQEHFEILLRAIQSLTSSLRLNDGFAFQLSDVDLLSAKRAAQQFILSSLDYRGRGDRKHFLPVAHETTFGWAESDCSQPTVKWNNLVKWIGQDDHIYWINGKAASGKSTLMKFLLNSSAIEKACRAWAGKNRLILDGFFFWHLGTDIQKSQEGLLRSLLHAILTALPIMCEKALPALYEQIVGMRTAWRVAQKENHEKVLNVKRSYPSANPKLNNLSPVNTTVQVVEDLTTDEVRAAFFRTVEHLPESVRIMFFIDGVDEYSGDPLEICGLLKSVASDKLRIVLSSRPTSSCIATFGQFPGLRLQDLTNEDISKFVTEVLSKNKRMALLQYKDAEATKGLMSQIVGKASGVFLWVYLVVNSLIVALDKGDRLHDLIARVDSLPEELTVLYKHMMENMEPSYRREGSHYIQLAVEALTVQKDRWNLTMQQLFYAEDCRPQDVIDTKPHLPDYQLLDMELESLEARLISRCCGLLEVPDYTNYADRSVVFLHKTVVDFLSDSENWDYILKLGEDASSTRLKRFCPSCSLAVSTVKMIQSYPVASEPPPDWIESQFYDESWEERAWFRIRCLTGYFQTYLTKCRCDVALQEKLDLVAKHVVKTYLEAGSMRERHIFDPLEWGGQYLLAGWGRPKAYRQFSYKVDSNTPW